MRGHLVSGIYHSSYKYGVVARKRNEMKVAGMNMSLKNSKKKVKDTKVLIANSYFW